MRSSTGSSARDDESGRRPTIWILVLALSIGGTERTIVDLANGVDKSRFDVEIWTVFDANPLAADVDDDVAVRTLGVEPTRGEERYELTGAANPLQYVVAPLRFVGLVATRRPDVLQSFLVYDNLVARVAGLASPGTTVLTGERGFRNASGNVLQTLDRLTVRFSDGIVSNSRGGAEYYADLGVPEEDLWVVPNGRNLEAYRDASGDAVAAELGLPEDVAVVGTVGRLVERKGHRDLLAAWERVRADGHDAHLVVVGHGPEREALEAQATSLGIADSVHFLGARDDVPEILDVLDAFVFPSHWEGLPGAPLEAMAAGLPIVATRVEGTRELVTHDETGVLVPPKDPPALAEALERVLTDSSYATRLGERAQTVAFEEYTRERMVENFEAVYAELTEEAVVEREIA